MKYQQKCEGKTALHWASAVNNVDAVRVLLQHGANRDAQDNKEETALFLAAREGSYQAARVLLEHYANCDITDHMDRLPRDMALERMHHDIVRLIDEYAPPNHQMNSMGAASNILGSPGLIQTPAVIGSMKGNRSKRRSKVNTIKEQGGDLIMPQENGTNVKRRASVKKRKEPPPPVMMQGLDAASVALSPVDSLESPPEMLSLDNASPLMDGPLYSNQMALNNAMSGQMDSTLCIPGKMPPSYEDCFKVSPHLAYALSNMDPMGQMYMAGANLSQHMQQLSPSASLKPHHPRQNSMPGSLSVSQPHVPVSHSYTVSSPVKQRPSLPTSPTHMAVMRAAYHQKTAQMQSQQQQQQSANNQQPTYDYPPMTDLQHLMANNGPKHNQQQHLPYSQHHYHYPTPPSQHSHGSAELTPQSYLHPPETYLTPSPESPGQWSSSSPHSAQSDWSEGMSSPLGPAGMQQQISTMDLCHNGQQNQQQQQKSLHQPPEAVFI